MLIKVEASINAQGKLYVPNTFRTGLGERVELLSNATALLVYSKGADLEDVLRSVEVILLDLRHRQALSEKLAKRTLRPNGSEEEG